jgi:hypothetical protein
LSSAYFPLLILSCLRLVPGVVSAVRPFTVPLILHTIILHCDWTT